MAQDRVLKDDILHEGRPPPDLATIKDIIRCYINSSKGVLTVRPVVSSALNFAERLFGGIARLTKRPCDPKDRSDVFYVSKVLPIRAVADISLDSGFGIP